MKFHESWFDRDVENFDSFSVSVYSLFGLMGWQAAAIFVNYR